MPYSKEWDELSDEEVLRLSRKNPDVFEVLVARYEDAFLRKATSILFAREDAEEVVQDAFTRIYIYADRFRPQEGASFSSWGYAILVRLCYTRYGKLKKEKGRTQELEPEAYERLPDTSEFLEDLSVRSEVLAALSKLPETAARILRLQFIEGKTQEEIAAMEGSSIPAVKTRVHRAKKLFKTIYDQQH
jgi:RNA polymerase sigma-70 factor, ECF subfamily